MASTRLEVELLEARCVLNAALDLGTIGPRIDYGPAVDVQWGDPVPLASMPAPGAWATNGIPYLEEYDYWSLPPALTQVDVWSGQWPTYVGLGEFDLAHFHLAAGEINYDFASLQRFTLPHAQSVGLSLSGGSVTVYQVALGSLWSTSTADEGLTWGGWQQVVSLSNPPAPTGPAPSMAPFGWLADMDAYEPGPDFDGDGMADAPGIEHPLSVYGTILAQDGVIRVGFEWNGERFSGLVTDGTLTTEAVDAFFLEGDWVDEVEVW